MPKLTIGFACYDDIEGAFFTLTSLRLHHLINKTDWEIVVIDDFPSKTKDLENCANLSGAKYFHVSKNKGPAHAKNSVFERAKGDYVLLMDSHVLLAPGSIDYIYGAIDKDLIGKDMWCGPLLNESTQIIATHLDPKWRGDFFGVWATDPEITAGKVKEIQMHGCAHFLMKRSEWPKFSSDFEGFAGEEGTIHEKVRLNGGKVLCHPKLGWIHRFLRSKPITYRCDLIDKIYNYLVGFYECGWSTQGVVNFFNTTEWRIWVPQALKRAAEKHPDILTKNLMGKTFEQIK